jgi:hypothetical protein
VELGLIAPFGIVCCVLGIVHWMHGIVLKSAPK